MRVKSGWVVSGVFCALLLPAVIQGAAITTEQSGISQVEIGGVLQRESTDSKTDGFVSVFALFGTLSTPEARTAARSSHQAMAANARIDDKSAFSFTDFSTVLSQSFFGIQVAPDFLFVRDATVDFVLPGSYLEVTSNVEIPYLALETVLLADLAVCFDVACRLADQVFHMQANLQASHRNYSYNVQVSGNSQLNLDPLRSPAVTDNGSNNFLRTVNVEFPIFRGHVELGRVPAGSPLRLEYVMQVRARGIGATNIGIAAINDPFLLDTDPVQMFDPLTLTLTPAATAVPEPKTLLTALAGLAGMLGAAGFLRKHAGFQ
jgi:hypothetical protein